MYILCNFLLYTNFGGNSQNSNDNIVYMIYAEGKREKFAATEYINSVYHGTCKQRPWSGTCGTTFNTRGCSILKFLSWNMRNIMSIVQVPIWPPAIVWMLLTQSVFGKYYVFRIRKQNLILNQRFKIIRYNIYLIPSLCLDLW